MTIPTHPPGPQIIAVITEMMTSKIPRPSPEIAIKSQSRITNPPTITADRDFFRFWGSRRGERGGEAEEKKFIPPIQQGAFQRIHRGNTQAASPGRLQNAAWVVALYHNEAALLHRERGARLKHFTE